MKILILNLQYLDIQMDQEYKRNFDKYKKVQIREESKFDFLSYKSYDISHQNFLGSHRRNNSQCFKSNLFLFFQDKILNFNTEFFVWCFSFVSNT